jgi:hypothetical protein
MTQGVIVAADSGRHLAFEITLAPLKIARWEYLIVPAQDDPLTCHVAKERTDRRPGWYRAVADRAAGSRLKTNQVGMTKTLPNFKHAAETAADKHAQPRG